VVFYSSRADEERLQSEYDISFSVVKRLSQINEQAKIKVQEQTPVFTTIEPAGKAIKLFSDEYKFSLMVLIAGLVIGIGIVFISPKIS